ncbi:MAG: hypothetical protein GKR98_06015 [Boseongicola sp.]|nr:MAG: hypothetical protein GKR98_06015 [Boseongicola sp.]
MLRLAKLSLAIVCSCAPTGEINHNRHTGVTVQRSAPVIKVLDATSRIEVSAIRVYKNGDTRWYLKTFVTRNDRNYPRISSA